jgi:hypothetical protein
MRRILLAIAAAIALGLILHSPATGWPVAITLFGASTFCSYLGRRPSVPCSMREAAAKFVKSYVIAVVIVILCIMLMRAWGQSRNRATVGFSGELSRDDVAVLAVMVGVVAFIIAYPIYRLVYKGPEWRLRDVLGRRRPTPATQLATMRRVAVPLPREMERAHRHEDGFALRGADTRQLARGGPQFARSAEAAATIVNLCLHSDLPATQLFGSVQLCILEAMMRVGDDLGERRS